MAIPKQATTDSAIARWINTAHQRSSVKTVIPPKVAAAKTSNRANIINSVTLCLLPYCLNDKTVAQVINIINKLADSLCEYSIRVVNSKGGII